MVPLKRDPTKLPTGENLELFLSVVLWKIQEGIFLNPKQTTEYGH